MDDFICHNSMVYSQNSLKKTHSSWSNKHFLSNNILLGTKMIFCAFFTNYWPKIRGEKQLFDFINILCFKILHVGASMCFLDEHM